MIKNFNPSFILKSYENSNWSIQFLDIIEWSSKKIILLPKIRQRNADNNQLLNFAECLDQLGAFSAQRINYVKCKTKNRKPEISNQMFLLVWHAYFYYIWFGLLRLTLYLAEKKSSK